MRLRNFLRWGIILDRISPDMRSHTLWAQRRFTFELAFCYPERRGGSPFNLPSATLGAEEVHLWTRLLLPWAQRKFTFELAFCYPRRRRGSPLNLPSATLGAEEVQYLFVACLTTLGPDGERILCHKFDFFGDRSSHIYKVHVSI